MKTIAADETEVDSVEQDGFISAHIILSEQGLDAADEAADDGRDVDSAEDCADDGAAAGDKYNCFIISDFWLWIWYYARSNMIGGKVAGQHVSEPLENRA